MRHRGIIIFLCSCCCVCLTACNTRIIQFFSPLYDDYSTVFSISIPDVNPYQSLIHKEVVSDNKNTEFIMIAKEKVDTAIAGTGDKLVTTRIWEMIRECLITDCEVLVSYGYIPEDFGLVGPEDFLATNDKVSIILFYVAACLGNQAISYTDGKYSFDPITELSAQKMFEYTKEDYIDASLRVLQASITPVEFDAIFGYEVVNEAYSYYALQEKLLFLLKASF